MTISSSRIVGAMPAVVFCGALALYWYTLAPTVTLVDSGELITAAATSGVAHPPGFPLYVMLAHVATLVPLGTVAQRVNFASALFAALAIAVIMCVTWEVLQAWGHQARAEPGSTRQTKTKRSTKQSARTGNARPEEWLQPTLPQSVHTLLPALVSAGLLAGSRTLWSYATVAEVYSLNTFLTLCVFLCVIRWRQVVASSGRATSDRWLYAAACVFGLALAVHHVTVLLTFPAIAVLVFRTAGWRHFAHRRLAIAAACCLAGLSVYAYLPLAASGSPALDWGDPRTLERFWWHITGRQYQVFWSFTTEQLGARLAEILRFGAREFGPWWLPVGLALAVLGFAESYRRDRTVFYFLSLVALADVAYGLNYEIAEDKAAYYLPAIVAIAIAAGVGAHLCLRAVAAHWSRARHGPALAGAALLCVPLIAVVGNFRLNDRSRDFIAADYVDNILTTIEPGGMLLTLDWQVYSPLMYVRTVERHRRDVVALDLHLLRRSWYLNSLSREYPEMVEGSREAIEAFRQELVRWEGDPDLYRRDPILSQRIDDRFHQMVSAVVKTHLQRHPVYVTEDVVLGRAAEQRRLAQLLTDAYQLVPDGLVFRLVPGRSYVEPAEPDLRLRGLTDGTVRFESDDVVAQKVLPAYVTMLYNRGRYLALNGRHDRAIRAFEQSLALDPTFSLARQALQDSRRRVPAQ
ncbi:MAG: protein O-mannosyl-transferase family [Candidatus Binatia bacterium]